jgi:hypothetical protein
MGDSEVRGPVVRTVIDFEQWAADDADKTQITAD